MSTTPRKVTATATATASIEERRARNIAIATAPGWRPAPGTTIHVRLIGGKIGESEYGVYPIAVVEDIDTSEIWAVHAFHEMLREQLAELAPTPDTEFTLHYVGKFETNESKVKFAAGGPENARTFYHQTVILPGDGAEDTSDSPFDFGTFVPKNTPKA